MNKNLSLKPFTEEEIRDRISSLFKGKGLRLAILFGSAVSGNVHRNSDIDIAFLFEKPVDILELTNTVIRLLHVDNVDVIDLRRASLLLKFSAVKNGKLIFEKTSGAFNEFCSLAFRMYVDTQKLRDGHAVFIKNYLKEEGIV
jgi:predicted nucleotidyltransferase